MRHDLLSTVLFLPLIFCAVWFLLFLTVGAVVHAFYSIETTLTLVTNATCFVTGALTINMLKRE